MAKEKSAIERFAESKFMRKLQEGSQKLASNEIFSTISGGMGATMGLIMVGAVIQIVCAVGAMFGWDTSSASYQAFYMPYKLTMGLMGFFMCFSMAYNYAKRKKMNQMQSVVTALVCYILVVSPPVSASVVAADGTIGRAFDALNLSSLGTGGMFVAIIVGLCSVAISKFVIDHNWTIKLPDAVPAQTINRFCSSGLQAISTVANAIAVGEYKIGIGGGVECMTKCFGPFDYKTYGNPWIIENYPGGYMTMGQTAENVANDYGFTREVMDEMALTSHTRAAQARKNGKLAPSIIPVVKPDGTTVTYDDGILADMDGNLKTSMEKMAGLKTCFVPEDQGGKVTAATSSQTTDAAAYVILMDEDLCQGAGH